MTEAELIVTALAELSTRQIAENSDATGLPANKTAAQAGGGIAKRARLQLESQTGRRVDRQEGLQAATEGLSLLLCHHTRAGPHSVQYAPTLWRHKFVV